MKYIRLFEALAEPINEIDFLILDRLSSLMTMPQVGYELANRAEPDRVIIKTVGWTDGAGDGVFAVRVELVPRGTIEAIDKADGLVDLIRLGLHSVNFTIRLDVIVIDEDSSEQSQGDLSITVDLTPEGAVRIDGTICHLVEELAQARRDSEIAYRSEYDGTDK